MSKETITNETPLWDYDVDAIIQKPLIQQILKFHQSTTIIHQNNYIQHSAEVLSWMHTAEYQDTLPNLYQKEIPLKHVAKKDFRNSVRDFTKERLSEYEFFNIIYHAFGRGETNSSKKYPSAGALYPVIPVLFIFEEDSIVGIDIEKGVYVLDTYKNSLKQLKVLTEADLLRMKQVIHTNSESFLSPYCIGYAIDIKKAIAKYKQRGYRHALIEVGLAAQSLRESCTLFERIGDVSWSGFDDHALTHASGLNPRISPIVLLQWFGKYEGMADEICP